MADQDTFVLGQINYWCREKHFRHMQNVTIEAQKKYPGDLVLKFFNALGMLLEGRVQESMRELDNLSNRPDVNLCSTLALIHGHRKAKNIDKETVQQLDAKLKAERKQGTDKAFFLAGLFLVHVEKYDKSQEYIDRAVKLNPQNKDIVALKGWLELLNGDEASAKKSIKFFEEALSIGGTKCLNALFGKAKYLELRRNFSGALDVINEAVVLFSQSIPALLEKMKLQVALQDWEQAVDTAQRALALNSNCLQAKNYLILHHLCKEGNYTEAASEMEDLLRAFNIEEPQNAPLLDKFARVYCRVSGRNTVILQQTYAFQEKAVTVDSDNPAYLSELGYELLLQNRPRDAERCFNNALKIDESSLFTLTGLLWCRLLENQLDEAAKQLEFLNELKDTIGTSAELVYLNALLSLKKNDSSDKTIELLDTATKKHFEGIRGLPLGTEYFLALNPDFLTNVVSDYLTFAPQQPLNKSQAAPNRILQKCLQVLDPLCKAVPGLSMASYLMAKTKFLSGDMDGATALLHRCLEQDSTSSDCHVLMAQIHLHMNNFKLANQSLEVGLSYNFEVRDHPIYHLIKARILKKQGDIDGAAKTLQFAMSLPGVKSSEKSGPFGGSKKKAVKITTNDRVSVFIELADAHRQLSQTHEAAKVMQDAMNDFQGTGEEVRIAIANADLALARGDVEGALAMLRGIAPEQTYYVQAREKMAEIYLNHRKDKRLYASCYRELAEKYPSPQTSLLLGDAYMSIDEPEKAIAEYESAMKKNPQDYALANKIGQALVKTHQFNKAISYYEASLKQGGQQSLRYDLAELLIRMKQFEKAEKVLKQALKQDDKSFDALVEIARYLLLLSRISHQQERYEEKVQYLMKAKETQDRILMRANVDQPESVHSLRQFAALICSEIAQHHIQQREFAQAIILYKEALSHSESDGKIMLELAKLYMMTEDLDSCQFQCMAMLKEDKEADSANVMLADVMFRKNDFEQAMNAFERLLNHRPDHYAGLEKVIEILRRAGKLEECTKFLDMAEKSSGRASIDAGFNYCKGLYEWYVGNPNKALKHFNKARKDADYGTKATYNMIEICLNPDNETIGGELFDAEDTELGREQADKVDSELIAIGTADKLLKIIICFLDKKSRLNVANFQEIKPKPGDLRYRVLCNMVMVATKNKVKTEEALSNFLEMTKAAGEMIGALYGSAVAYMVLKQAPKARNQLKRILKSGWTMEDAEELERSWLLLADIYIQSNKYDQATDILKRCLQYNKSCCKAYEYLGYLMEKEQSYKDAAQNYELAWRYANRNNPSIGYKLAFNYLKAKRYVDAIDVCHQVLLSHPTYPKIKKEILDKARSMIRVAGSSKSG